MSILKTLTVFLIILVTPAIALAQKHWDFEQVTKGVVYEPTNAIEDLSKNLGKEVYLGETIWGSQILNDTTKVLYIGGIYPYHKVAVLLKGKKVKDGLSTFHNGDTLYFSGIVTLQKGIPTITISNLGQVGRRVQI